MPHDGDRSPQESPNGNGIFFREDGFCRTSKTFLNPRTVGRSRDLCCAAALPSFVSEPADYARAAELAGNARRAGQGKPGLIDGLIAAIALRTGAMVATQNTKDFDAMGCPCANQIEALTCPPSA